MSIPASADRVIQPFGFVQKILKVPVFRMALGDDCISRIIIAVYNFFASCCSSKSFRAFDPRLAQRSLDRFTALGAQIRFVTPRDGKGQVQMMHFKAQDLEQKVNGLGGKWEKRVVNQREVFAIVPPAAPDARWNELKEKMTHFHWKEEEGMLITCDSADAIPQEASTKCFLVAHSTSSTFSSDWKRAGFYIGAKQDLCFFDNGNSWKNKGRDVSEEGFNLDIEAVHRQIQNQYATEDLWVGGGCGGAPVAAFLKRKLHEQGVNYFAEQSFPNMQDFSVPMGGFFMPRVKGSLQSRELPANFPDRPEPCQFGVEKMWRHLNRFEGPKGGKVILVQVEGDEEIPAAASARYLALCRRVNRTVTPMTFTSAAAWKHADDFYRYPEPRRTFLRAVFE